MPLFDLPLEQLKTYCPEVLEPSDFDAFWQQTLAATRVHALNIELMAVASPFQTVESFDLTFSGYNGQRIKAWLTLPKIRAEKIAGVVEFVDYGGGRGEAHDALFYASAGYAHIVMDTRGQGSVWSKGSTPDIDDNAGNGHIPGFMTKGITHQDRYYYRRVFTDAVRAIETAKQLSMIDPTRIAVTGGSQGGGIAIAAAALEPVLALAPDVPFLCHYRRATEIVATNPYAEITQYLKMHRDQLEQVFTTLSYFDGINFAKRTSSPALYSVGLMDEICPPSTVYAAYNHHAGQKEIRVYPYNNHEGGQSLQGLEKLRFFAGLLD